MSVLAREKLRRAVADVPAHIDHRLVEVDAQDVVALCDALLAGPAPSEAAKLAVLREGCAAAPGRSVFIQAESVRCLLAQLDPPPAPEPDADPA